MIDPIVHDIKPITLVGGGEANVKDLQKSLKLAPTCVAVDSGAALALAAGAEISAVIGDFDSVLPETLRALPDDICHRVSEQTSTDFEKALTRVRAPVVIGVGFLGGRIDHQLAAFHTLLACADRPCVLIGQTEIVCLAPPHLSLEIAEGEVVSLFPMARVTGQSSGLVWPIDGLELAPDGRIGTSNRATGPVTLAFDAAEMLLILPRHTMPALVSAIAQPEAARWPARV